jgi:hypothetical protein
VSATRNNTLAQRDPKTNLLQFQGFAISPDARHCDFTPLAP